MSRTVFQNANVLDGSSAGRKADVVVEGNRIVSVGAGTATRPDDEVYDLSGKSLLPGLTSGHSHLSYINFDPTDFLSLNYVQYPATYMAVGALQNAEATLRAGYTLAIGAGGIYNLDVVLNQLIADGRGIGPRIIPSGYDLIPTGHVLDGIPEHYNMKLGPLSRTCDGPLEMRKAVRDLFKQGNQIVKVFVEGGHGVPARSARMSYDEIAAIVETAESCNMRVRAHTYSKPMIKACLKAGVHIIDHGDHMDEELAGIMVERGVFVLPSLYLLKAHVGVFHTQADCDKWYGLARQSLAIGLKAGVKFVTGDDWGTVQTRHGTNARELGVYVNDIGIAPLEVLKWATKNGAEMAQRADLGQIAPDKLADLIIVDGDPVADITLIADPAKLLMVMQDGKVISSQLEKIKHARMPQLNVAAAR